MAQPVEQSPRLKALQNLSNALPVANSRVAQGQQAARDIQLQQAVKAAPQGQNTTQAAQQTGAAAAQQAGQENVQRAQNMIQQQGQIGQLALGEQSQANQQNLAGQQLAAGEQQMNNVQRLAAISENAKQELYDKQMKFDKDEAGRTLFNEMQLLDYAKANAQTDEQYKNYAQEAQQLSNRNMQFMEAAFNKVMEDLNYQQKLAEQAKDNTAMMEIQAAKAAMQDRMNGERTTANNINTALGAAGSAGMAAAMAFSDKRLKKNIKEFDAEKFLDQLSPSQYDYIDEKLGKGKQVGVMAQDIEKHVPQAIIETEIGKAVDYSPAKMGGPILASLSSLNKRLRQIEGKK